MRVAAILALVLGCVSVAAAQDVPPAPAPPTLTLESVAAPHQPLIRQRARHFYRLPDGSLWDGWNYAEYRKVLDRSLRPFSRKERGEGGPGQTLIEDRTVGTVWKIKPSADAEAWNLEANLADRDGVVGGAPGPDNPGRPRGPETVDPRTWRETPALWTSMQAPDSAWPFAFIDESDPDLYTRRRSGGYLRVTRIWAEDRFEFEGYSLDGGQIDGIVTVHEPRRHVDKDRFKGSFFLWPEGREPEAAGPGRRLWRLIPADDARLTPDELARAVLTGQARIVDWDLDRIGKRSLWKQSIRDIREAEARPAPKAPGPTPTPSWPDAGPDLVVLNDGRWFRGRVTKKDDQEVVIVTRLGQMDAPLIRIVSESRARTAHVGCCALGLGLR